MLGSYCTHAAADNWHGSITSKLQVDNRYTNNASVFAEGIGRFEYQNSHHALAAGADVLLRGGSDALNTRQEFYRLFVQKTLPHFNTTLKLGRFEQSDGMGFYTLNGANANYQSAARNFSVDVYAGMPQRFDDLQAVKGSVVAGIKSFWHQALNWRSNELKLSVDTLDVRLGYLYFAGRDMSRYVPEVEATVMQAAGHKITLGANLSGTLWQPWLKRYEARFIGVYRADTERLEDVQFETEVVVSDNIRMRGSYEYYQPNRTQNPTFREQFYSQYGFGQQQVLRVSLQQHWQPYLSASLGGIYSAQQNGLEGYGFTAGLTSRYLRNYRPSLELEHLQFNTEAVTAVYVKNEYFINSRNSLTLSLALRDEYKQLYGQNWVTGGEARWDYLIKNNIVLGLSARYVANSRLDDQFLGAVQLTYYFEPFKPKAAP